ncbi:MAG: membrane protein insertion efficiency factor YidD [Bacteroidetes bacterium]|nr:membrane protein insertion efficiency factor YidD [Bacteroidota bacterium]
MKNYLAILPRRILIGLVRGYQLILSPHLGSACRYHPTCSAYAIEAIGKYGAWKGGILATHRIFRCNPWGGHGDDPPIWYSERPGRKESHDSSSS